MYMNWIHLWSGRDYIRLILILIGTPLFGRKANFSEEPAETTVVRAGIFDDRGILNERKPELEIFTDSRLEWVCSIEKASQFSGMLAPQESDSS